MIRDVAGVALPFAHAGDWIGGLLFAVPILALVLFFRVLSRLADGKESALIEAADPERPTETGADRASMSTP